MLLANPIYDSVFKHLMEDDEIARGLIGRLLDVKVVSLQGLPHEITQVQSKQPVLSRKAMAPASRDHVVLVFRLDFAAEVELSDGSRHKVLIELQKASSPEVMSRFRNYLSRHYAVPAPEGSAEEDAALGQKPVVLPAVLPIIAIYILGFMLGKDIPKVVRVERRYLDAVTGQGLPPGVKDEFLEKLTHDAVAVQVPLIDEHATTDLERALLVFNQNWRAQGNPHYLEVEEDFDAPGHDQLVQRMTRKLLMAAADDETRRQMELEDELARTAQREEAAEQRADEAEQRADEAERRADEAERQKEEERRQKEDERRQKEEERRHKEEALARLAEMEEKLRKLEGGG